MRRQSKGWRRFFIPHQLAHISLYEKIQNDLPFLLHCDFEAIDG
jgi:hypothetical protein